MKNPERQDTMASTKSLVVYYSRSGHAKDLAQRMASALGADLEEISTPVNYQGRLGYARALWHSLFLHKPRIKGASKRLFDYDRIVIGGPVWGGEVAAPVRAFLTKNKNDLMNVAFFITQGGTSGRERMFRKMQNACGSVPIATLALTDQELKENTFQKKLSSFVSAVMPEKRSRVGMAV
ncbi:MAG: flavodoxin family protein [Bdellovibrionota bacterium]